MMRRGGAIVWAASAAVVAACSGGNLLDPLEPLTAPPQATEPCVGPTCEGVVGEAGASGVDGASTSPEPYEPCADRICGDSCRLCDPADESCVETPAVKRCGATGACTAAAPVCATQPGDAAAPDGEAPDAAPAVDAAPPPPPPPNPCAGKRCGDQCERCTPGDPECGEVERIGYCAADRRCGRKRPLCGRRDGGRPDPVE